MAITNIKNMPGEDKQKTGQEVFAYILGEQRKNQLSKEKVLEEYVIWQAAWYAITGKELFSRDTGTCDIDKLYWLAEQLAQPERDAEGYVAGAYKNYPSVRPANIESDAFLKKQLDSHTVVLPDRAYLLENGQALEEKILQKAENGGLIPAEYLMLNTTMEPANEYSNEDRSTYEYEAEDDAWRKYSACVSYAAGKAGMGNMTNTRVRNEKANPINQAVMKNKRTVEKAERGDYRAVANARENVKNSFTFYDTNELKQAQQRAIEVLFSMRARMGEYRQSREWQNLISKVEAFTKARNLDKAAEISADILAGVEKFTKGKKSRYNNEQTINMVNDSLSALSCTIPDVTHNSSVKPLIDRFNAVRKHRLQRRVTLEDPGFRSALARDPFAPAPDPNIPEVVDEKAKAFDSIVVAEDNKVVGKQIRNFLYEDSFSEDAEQNEPGAEQADANNVQEQNIVNNVANNVIENVPEKHPANLQDVIYGDAENANQILEGDEDLGDLQELIYGSMENANQLLEGEINNNILKIGSKEEAYQPVRNFINQVKKIPNNKLENIDSFTLTNAIATMIAVEQTEPLQPVPNRPQNPDEINEIEVEARRVELIDSEEVATIVSAFKNDATVRNNMMRIMTSEEGKPERKISEKMNELYKGIRQELHKQKHEKENIIKNENIIKEDSKESLKSYRNSSISSNGSGHVKAREYTQVEDDVLLVKPENKELLKKESSGLGIK